jgi:hypothetical protein
MQELAAYMALVMRENDGIDGRAGSTGSVSQDFGGAMGQDTASGIDGSSPPTKACLPCQGNR